MGGILSSDRATLRDMNILLIEDDPSVADFIRKGLEAGNCSVDWVADGELGLEKAQQATFAVMIIDRMLPGLDGLSLVKCLREAGDHTPVLILSALGEVDDRVKGLQAGADDYLAKPFSFAELQARVEVLSRRGGSDGASRTTRQVGDLHMDLLTQQVSRDGQSISLQPREYKLLEFLMRHSGQVVTRAMLLEHVWGYHFDPQTNVIDVHISRLRQKIDKDFPVSLLSTVRGAGYILGPEQDAGR
jgi:two-component system OmpR family response regulator